MNSLELCSLNRRNELASSCPHSPGAGGSTWVFFGWGRAARDSKLAPRSKKKPLKVMPRSRNRPIFVYPVLEFVLKLIPRSGNGPVLIQDGGVSARGSRQNTPALHAKTQGATRVQQFAC